MTIPFQVHPSIRPVPDTLLRQVPRDGLNLLCDISDWRDGRMLHYLAQIREPVRIHRKAWEFGKLLAAFEKLGVMQPDAVGLSVGAGTERPLFYLASTVKKMIASDLYVEQLGTWGWGAGFLENPAAHSPFPYREEGLEVVNMSGLDLRYPDDTFDFVYTLSSIEHFGGHEAARQCMREMARVVRPGGVVCVVTELQLSVASAPDIFTYPDLEEYLIRGSSLRLIEPGIDLRLSTSQLAFPSHMTIDPDDVSPRIVMTGWAGSAAVWGSIILFFTK